MSSADITGTSDEVSPAALPPVNPIRESRIQRWTRDGAALMARNPGYVLAGAAVVGFLMGRMVKRLLLSSSRRE